MSNSASRSAASRRWPSDSRSRSHSTTSAPPTLRSAGTGTSDRINSAELSLPVVCRACWVTPASSVDTKNTAVPVSVSAGTRYASASTPNGTRTRLPVST
ncbi:Uncharacterised protein [Mycobacteroides abscessus subsp. abscessus]|nr:Uncharacterised protein [Mycobacteroides abscessus subsp. abscessus]